jgi:hypothetical protein
MWSKTAFGYSCFAEEKISQPYDDSDEDLRYYEDGTTLHCIPIGDDHMAAHRLVE